jgi:hypothetical protein
MVKRCLVRLASAGSVRAPVRLLVAIAVLAVAVLGAAPARGSISAAVPIDGPGREIVDLGGVAMAPDGTGGLVYRRIADGRTHVFAAQFVEARWLRPQRVDSGQRFDSSWPAIGAADGGRLVVTWVQEFGPASDRMYSATLDAGARRFQPPVPVDLNVGEATATWPSLAVNRGGAAYLAYLVLQRPTGADPPGTARGELRVARSGGQLWSGFGFPLNRNPQGLLRLPTAATAPRVAIDVTGNGIVAWAEPDEDLIDRVWARRLFGGQAGIPLAVSPREWGGRALRGPADGFALDVAGFGQGAIAFRQQAGEGGALAGARLMLATIPETFATGANAFGPPRLVDGAGDGAPAAPGSPAVATTRAGDAAVAFSLAQRTLLTTADDRAVERPARLDDGRSSAPGDPRAELGVSGAAAIAWKLRRGAAGGVGISERRADAVPVRQLLSAPVGGPVGGLELAGSGLGDALVAWVQGPDERRQVAAAVVDAPPDPFSVQTPVEWVRRGRVRLRWDEPPHAIGGIRYALTIDDDTVAEDVSGTARAVPLRRLDDGVRIVQVVAEDSGGQETTSYPSGLRIDTRAPRVRIRRVAAGRVRVRLVDGRPGRVAGVARASVRVSWGDGRRTEGRTSATHRYRRAGRVRIEVRARDRAGNRVRARRWMAP